jgi:Trypsin-like peptidase domain
MASVRSLLIEATANGSRLGTATGFLVQHDGSACLVTNWHVVTGRRPDNGVPLSATGAVPDSLTVWHNAAGFLGRWIAKQMPLLGPDDDPLWFEHPTHGRRVDAVALSIDQEADVATYPYDLSNPGPAVLASPSNPVSIIGFPFGLSSSGRLAIWTQGTIASEIDFDFEDLPCFLVDSRTRSGQSGAPVLLYRVGSYLGEDGGVNLGSGEIETFAGVYSGRINAESDLGRVWKPSALLDILAAQQRGPLPTLGSG